MRIKSSIINVLFGLGSQIIITALSFISRTVFINSLGIEYLGINGLLTNILAMLSLAEAGIGSSIIYSLYKPVADNDYKKVNILMKFYRNAYLVIALVVLLLGLVLMPFLGFFIKNSSVDNVHIIYLIFLLNTVFPYLYVHKNSFLNVSQKGYIVTGIYTVSSIVTLCIRIGVLHYTENYILYLVIESCTILLTSFFLATIVNKKYPYLKNKVVGKLDNATKHTITKNVKAIVLQNIGNYLVVGTDNIIISSFISVAAVGLYSNYNMLLEICRNLTNQIFNNVYHSVGNLVAEENTEKIYFIFKVYRFLTFWLYSIVCILLFITLGPFITNWIGQEYLMSSSILFILLLIFYERGMRNAITTVKSTAGIFHEDRYVPLLQAAINLILSIWLVQQIGMIGVFIGTLVSTIAGPFWTTPFLVYKNIFKKSLLHYYLSYSGLTILGVSTYIVTNYLCGFVSVESWVGLIYTAILCLFIPNIIYCVIFYKTEEFKYLIKIITTLSTNILNKLMSLKTSKTHSY